MSDLPSSNSARGAVGMIPADLPAAAFDPNLVQQLANAMFHDHGEASLHPGLVPGTPLTAPVLPTPATIQPAAGMAPGGSWRNPSPGNAAPAAAPWSMETALAAATDALSRVSLPQSGLFDGHGPALPGVALPPEALAVPLGHAAFDDRDLAAAQAARPAASPDAAAFAGQGAYLPPPVRPPAPTAMASDGSLGAVHSSLPSHEQLATLADDALNRCVLVEAVRSMGSPARYGIAVPSGLDATGPSGVGTIPSNLAMPGIAGPHLAAPPANGASAAGPAGGRDMPADPLAPAVFTAMANSLFQSSGVPAEPQRAPVSPTSLAAAQAGRTAEIGNPATRLDIEATRADFPILHQRVHGKPLVWLDNAATTQKPRQVVERVRQFYYEDNSNVHRGAHTLAARATDSFEEARGKVAAFLGASSAQEIVFTRGTTDAINLVAASFGRIALGPGDEIIVSQLEHHSNIVPWQFIALQLGAKIVVAPVDGNGNLLLDEYAARLSRRTRIVAMTQVSNAIGTVLPIAEITAMAHRVGARVMVDGAQSVQHMPVNVQELGCDFFCLSGHKIFAPTGIGVLYGRRELLEEMPPYQGGGSMIDQVTFEHSTYAPVPAKFEAGTGILAGAVGLGAALDYVTQVGLPIIERHESALMAHAVAGLSALRRVKLIGNPRHRAGALSFIIEGMDVPTVGAMLDREGIAVRAGHHCAQPALAHFGLKASVRPSFAFYNNAADIDALIAAVAKIVDGVP